jgi:cytokinin riboside 5'-monophosphate phosphoribohydrolase
MERTSARKITNICVFCGSSPNPSKEFLDAAKQLGQVLAERNIHLVYGGGNLGLMGCVSKAAYERGSQVLGIIPKALKHITGETVGEELVVSSMHERKAAMLKHADAFIALPGGLGTLEEIFEVASWASLKIHQKPIGLLNVNGFFIGLLSFIDQAVENKFISPSARQFIISATTAHYLIDKLVDFIPVHDPTMPQLDWSVDDSSKRRRLDLTLHL